MTGLAEVDVGIEASGRRWTAWPVLVLLAALLVAHIGCHGDEDNELFMRHGSILETHEKEPGDREPKTENRE